MKPIRNHKGEVRQIEKGDIVMIKYDNRAAYGDIKYNHLRIINLNEKVAQVYLVDEKNTDMTDFKIFTVKCKDLKLVGTKEMSFKDFYNNYYSQVKN